MQAALAALPELPVVGHQAEAAPVRRARRLQQELGAITCCGGHQFGASFDHLALRAGPGADAMIQRARLEVGIALGIRHFGDTAFDTHHALKLDPVKLQGSKRVAGQLAALAALVVGEPGDAALVVTLDQHHAGAGAQVVADGGQRHGVGFWHLGLESFV